MSIRTFTHLLSAACAACLSLPAGATTVVFDFDSPEIIVASPSDLSASPYDDGEIIGPSFVIADPSGFGLRLTSVRPKNSDGTQSRDLSLFQTNCTGGGCTGNDADLGLQQGLVVITQDENANPVGEPDDAPPSNAGSIEIELIQLSLTGSPPVEFFLKSITLGDLESNQPAQVFGFDSASMLVGQSTLLSNADRAFATWVAGGGVPNRTDVDGAGTSTSGPAAAGTLPMLGLLASLRVDFEGSGALMALEFDVPMVPAPAPLALCGLLVLALGAVAGRRRGR